MKFSRRSFIGNISIAALAVMSGSSAGKTFGQTAKTDNLFFVPPESMSDPINYFTSKHFEPFVNTSFKVNGGSHLTSQLVLKEVTNLEHQANKKGGYSGESFSLLFKGSARRKLVQDTYRFTHDALGEFTFLAVPVGISGTGYEVIVNRIGR